MDVLDRVISDLESLCSAGGTRGGGATEGGGASLKVVPQSFEKDDDANGHIDFITAASVSNLASGSIRGRTVSSLKDLFMIFATVSNEKRKGTYCLARKS